MIAAQFCIQGINAAFFLLLNYYLTQVGFADFEVAEIISLRFLAVGLLAFPLGLFIKGRALKPFLYLSSVVVPVCGILCIWAADHHYTWLLYGATFAWGLGFMCMQIVALPFILLNSSPQIHSEAISLSYLSFGATIFAGGILYGLLNFLNPALFNERNFLYGVAALSALSMFFTSRIVGRENRSDKIPLNKIWQGYDWLLIIQALLPTLIIAIGAGFTIPVINLFFLNVHGVPSEVFSILGAFTFLLVAVVMLFMPAVKRRFGYRVAILLFQSLAILALFGLATTEYYKDWVIAAPLAMFFYITRQPLMNAAQPMTSELALYYVGPRNHEIVSALSAAIWSGSFFISTTLFSWMRQWNLAYVEIFLITVGLYVVGVVWYAWLIHQYQSRPEVVITP